MVFLRGTSFIHLLKNTLRVFILLILKLEYFLFLYLPPDPFLAENLSVNHVRHRKPVANHRPTIGYMLFAFFCFSSSTETVYHQKPCRFFSFRYNHRAKSASSLCHVHQYPVCFHCERHNAFICFNLAVICFL